MKIIIPTCDKYINVLEAEKYTLDKCGGSGLDVTVLGFKKPNFDMGLWKFVSLGIDTGPQNLSHDLWKFFEHFEDEYFIYGNDDIVAVDNLDLTLLADMENMMKINPNVMKICITSATKVHYASYPVFENKGSYQYRLVPQTAPYRLSLNYGIWRTSYFQKYCRLGAGHWEWETRNSAINDGAILLGTMGRYVLDFGHLFRHGNKQLSGGWYKSEYTGKGLSMQDYNYVTGIIRKI